MTFSLASKIAFICNLCMIAAILMSRYDIMADSGVRPVVIVAGYLLAILFNVIVFAWLLVLLIRKQSSARNQLTFLPIVNGLFMFVQLYLLLK